MRRVGILPALVTLANGFCGLLAIYKTHDGHYSTAALLILLAMVFDLLDGMVARRAGITSRFGAYLDSLSDAISFAVAPAFMAKVVTEDLWPGLYPPKVLTLLTVLFALCALLRLARYNVEHPTDGEPKAVTHFAGMPTPGAAGIVAGLVFLQYDEQRLFEYRYGLIVLPVLTAVIGYLMVSRIPFIHFGSKFLKGRRDFLYLFRVVAVLVLIILFPHEFCALGFLLYGLSGPVAVVRRRPGAAPVEQPPPKVPEGL